MKKLGIVSDSHGNLVNLREAVNYLVEEIKIDYLIHLGDDYKDTKILDEYKNIQVFKVPGVYDPEYKDPSIEQRLLIKIEEVNLLLSHTLRTHKTEVAPKIRPEEVLENKRADIILFGHTHKYSLEKKNDILLLNPGHLKEEREEGSPPTLATIKIEAKSWQAVIYDLKRRASLISI